MLLIIFLGLFAKLTLVSGDCDDGIPTVTNFDYPKLGIARVNNSVAVRISEYQLDISDCVDLNN